MLKLIAMGLTSVLGLSLAGLVQEPPPPPGGGPPPPKAKGKKGAPGDELRKTYDLLRRVRADTGSGRTEERIKDWTDRATDLYRRAIRTREQGDLRRTVRSAPRLTIWPAPSIMPATQLDSTDLTRTCPLLPTAPVPKTSMTERAVTSTGPTSAFAPRGNTVRRLTQGSFSMRRVTFTTPRDATSRPVATNARASSPAPLRR